MKLDCRAKPNTNPAAAMSRVSRDKMTKSLYSAELEIRVVAKCFPNLLGWISRTDVLLEDMYVRRSLLQIYVNDWVTVRLGFILEGRKSVGVKVYYTLRFILVTTCTTTDIRCQIFSVFLRIGKTILRRNIKQLRWS